MGDVTKLSEKSLREAVAGLQAQWKQALDDHHDFLRTTGRRLNTAQKQREAYLRGVLHGVALAMREFEKRAPIEFYGSGDQK